MPFSGHEPEAGAAAKKQHKQKNRRNNMSVFMARTPPAWKEETGLAIAAEAGALYHISSNNSSLDEADGRRRQMATVGTGRNRWPLFHIGLG
jgi:hypothetical protein